MSPDRPSKPYGFLVYKASPESVLLPLGVDYGRIFHKLWKFNYVQWEGISYVGLVAATALFVLMAGLVKKIIKRNSKTVFQVTDNYFLNIMFWASMAALLYSFGIPFIFGLGFLVEYLRSIATNACHRQVFMAFLLCNEYCGLLWYMELVEKIGEKDYADHGHYIMHNPDLR